MNKKLTLLLLASLSISIPACQNSEKNDKVHEKLVRNEVLNRDNWNSVKVEYIGGEETDDGLYVAWKLPITPGVCRYLRIKDGQVVEYFAGR
jgi:hypothetical protein